MTVATLLSYMAILDNELEVGSGEDDEDSAITALNLAQDYFEILAANYAEILSTTFAVTTTALTEATTYPTGVLRLDSLWMVDTASTPNLPAFELDPIYDVGGHRTSGSWVSRVMATGRAPGQPVKYWTNEEQIFWAPLPDAVYTLRGYGLRAKDDFALRSDTFNYRDHVAHPLAVFACKVLSLGVGDSTAELEALATQLFTPLMRKFRRFQRQGPRGRAFTEFHTT